ncbi:hypothetical protein BWZ22_00840 [Seonamhaeicola sp. S2-3]|uniref:hypothetical protein n=1 Tax=Seonamhaeicola sp. S2-3 TaxID=1936081 RepID=UPI0009729F13|nr:hypothetical protein [Seonamhaeicola sp. S2-3]APY09875.1 hypothetical protein BWZ22_00840 [Seonamhaeicola sp. S2-3]
MKNNIIILLCFLTFSSCFSQQKITWDDLAKVKFVEKYYQEYDESYLVPEFSDSVKALDGKTVNISGYFLHISPKDKLYMLSKGPMSACFFCGVGGPETAIELQFSERQNLRTDDIVTVTGTLKLNVDDVEHFNYILTDCEIKLIETD